jgi:hypothetical protein
VAMLVLLLQNSEGDFCLRQELVAELAQLGVSNVALLRDEQTVGLVVEGWAFDPHGSARALVDALAGPKAHARTLHPLMELAVSAGALEHGGELR